MRPFALLPLFCSMTAFAGPEANAPRGEPPRLWLASASEQKGDVVIRISTPTEKGAGEPARGLGPGVQSLGATTVMTWDELGTVTLGKTAEAFRANGERADRATVLKVLAKPKGVAVFVRTEAERPQLEPFYLSLLREDVLILTVRSSDLYPNAP